MLFNPDHAKYMHEEYERRVADFRLERKLRKARALRTQHMAHLVEQGIQLVGGWVTVTWRQVRWAPPTPSKQADTPVL